MKLLSEADSKRLMLATLIEKEFSLPCFEFV